MLPLCLKQSKSTKWCFENNGPPFRFHVSEVLDTMTFSRSVDKWSVLFTQCEDQPISYFCCFEFSSYPLNSLSNINNFQKEFRTCSNQKQNSSWAPCVMRAMPSVFVVKTAPRENSQYLREIDGCNWSVYVVRALKFWRHGHKIVSKADSRSFWQLQSSSGSLSARRQIWWTWLQWLCNSNAHLTKRERERERNAPEKRKNVWSIITPHEFSDKNVQRQRYHTDLPMLLRALLKPPFPW